MQKFQRTRHDHSQEITEDYLEKIHELIQTQGEARGVDLATHFGVSAVNVSKILQRLHKEGYVQVQPYRAVFLTDTGKALAEKSKKKHQVIKEFLLIIGVPEEVAEMDSEGIEHHISAITLEKIERFLLERS